jgi:hypothetical protein
VAAVLTVTGHMRSSVASGSGVSFAGVAAVGGGDWVSNRRGSVVGSGANEGSVVGPSGAVVAAVGGDQGSLCACQEPLGVGGRGDTGRGGRLLSRPSGKPNPSGNSGRSVGAWVSPGFSQG